MLRKEGVSFPPRDPNERLFMSSLGVDSPMFDYVEQISGRTVGGGPTQKEGPTKKEDGKRQKLDLERKKLQENDDFQQQ